MNDKSTPKQQNGLIFGYKKRYIGALQGLLGSSYATGEIETFTPTELDAIKRICDNAQARAKTCFEETRDRLDRSEPSGGLEAESRTYNGK